MNQNVESEPDKYKSVWVSHSSMGDFMRCPRAYYLKNVWKNPDTGKKMSVITPVLSLGSAVHEVIEGLAEYKAEERESIAMMSQFEKVWQKYSGKKGGFSDEKEEEKFKNRGRKMIERVINNLGPLKNKTVKLKAGKNDMPPNYFLSIKDNIILCGKIDWLEYIPEDDSVHIIDFKTGQNDEKEDSLQLPIYQLLLHNLQKRKVSGASYWYLDRDNAPKVVKLPDLEESYEKVIKTAKEVKEARELGKFECKRGKKGCFSCEPFEMVIRGEAEFVGKGEYGQDLYIVNINKIGESSKEDVIF